MVDSYTKSAFLKNVTNIVDLTFPIQPHWRYSLECNMEKSFDKGDSLNTRSFKLNSHWYTHIDAPLHVMENGKNLSDFPLDILVSNATIIDLSFVKENEGITRKHLEKSIDGITCESVILLKTDWDQKTNWTTKDYWSKAPYVTEEAAIYLREINPRVVGFDFPQDYDIRMIGKKNEKEIDLTTHIHLLQHDILLIEYLANLWKIKQKSIGFIALPLAVPNTDGAPIRAIGLV